MKKTLKLLLFACVLFLVACSNNNIKYAPWKDTIASFGDGTYQILHQSVDNKTVSVLMNCKHNQCVLTDIENYTQEKDFVYFTGDYYTKKVFCRLNSTNNMLSYFIEDYDEDFVMVYIEDLLKDKQIEIYTSLENFSPEDKAVFEHIDH